MSQLALLTALYFSLSTLNSDHKAITREQYIAMWKDEAVYQMAVHKIPASITLAQGILESGDGNSRLAREGNNHFGIKCHDDWSGARIFEDDETKGECFRKYQNAKESYEDHSVFLLRKRYERLFSLKSNDYRGWARGLKDCGYATNPSYPQLLIKIIEEFELDKFDEEGIEYIRKNRIPSRNSDDVVSTPQHQEKEKSTPRSKSKNGKNEDERLSITISGNREVLLSDNKIKYVVAKQGDSQESIALDLDLNVWLLRKFNEFDENETIREGQMIYLQPKRNHGSIDTYIVMNGDSPKSISEKFGIKLKKLYKLNDLKPGAELQNGRTLKLRR